jgi:hypothetical protein
METNKLTGEQSLKIGLDYVARTGWYIFPIAAGESKPPLIKDYAKLASNDPAVIRRWATAWERRKSKGRDGWEKWEGCNWGLGFEKSGIIAADIDTKLGKDGAATFAAIEADPDLGTFPETYEVRSRSGGRHLYYTGKHIFALGGDGFGKDIDSPRYVVIEGCVTGGGEYTLAKDIPVVEAPAWFYSEKMLGKVREKRARAVPDAECEPAYTNEEFAVLIKMLDPEAFNERPKWLRLVFACTHSSTVEDGRDPFMGWTIKGSGYAGDWEVINDKWDEGVQNRNKGDGAQVGTFNHFLREAGVPDDMLRWPKQSSPAEDFGDDDAEADTIVTEAATDKVKRQIRSLRKKTTKAGCSPEEAAAAAAKVAELMTKYGLSEDDLGSKKKKRPPASASFDDFVAYLPEHKYIFRPTGALWPAQTINSVLGPSGAYELDAANPVHSMAWSPGAGEIVKDRVLTVTGGWVDAPGKNSYNLYRAPPPIEGGDATQAGPWVDHIRKLFPGDDGMSLSLEASHLIKCFAHRVRFPGIKINHGIILGSDAQGIGKDSILTPIETILGEWNVADISAHQAMDEKYNPFLRSLLLKINEATDLADADRFDFYNRRKPWMAGPPARLAVTDKYVGLCYVDNVVFTVISGNDKAGMHLDPDDRRHFTAWSELRAADFESGYFDRVHRWYDVGGTAHVAAYLAAVDLSDFDPKAPPPKTAAHYEIMNMGRPSEAGALGDLLDYFDAPFSEERPTVVTIEQLREVARWKPDRFADVHDLLNDRKMKKQLGHRLREAGYTAVRNTSAQDGRWLIGNTKGNIYGRKDRPEQARQDAAQALAAELSANNAAQQRARRAARKASRLTGAVH